MKKRLKNRLISILLLLFSVFIGVFLILVNLDDNLIFFHPPSEIHKITNKARKVRVGGLVKKDSILYEGDEIRFIITDRKSDLTIFYQGLLPVLFREGQGIIAEGYLKKDYFKAERLLAKHDENYKPPELKFLESTQDL